MSQEAGGRTKLCLLLSCLLSTGRNIPPQSEISETSLNLTGQNPGCEFACLGKVEFQRTLKP